MGIDASRRTVEPPRESPGLGAGVGSNGNLTRHLPTAVHGRAAWVVGSPDLPHTWTDVLDVARTLTAIAARPDT